MLDRRRFLSHTAAGLGFAMAAGHPLLAQLANMPEKLPDPAQFSGNDDAYWAKIRRTIPSGATSPTTHTAIRWRRLSDARATNWR